MKNKLYEELFDFDISNIKKISVSKNEIYNQLLLYIFFTSKKNILLVVPTLNEATEIYNEMKNYLDEVYLFPEDDFMTKKAIASSPELLYMRANILNKFEQDTKKIIIVHLNSFIKKLPAPSSYKENRINLKINNEINREEFINKLVKIGYKRESMVYETSDFAVRGFIIDIYPINEENPIRIELFDDTIEKIKYFDAVTQKSIKEIEENNYVLTPGRYVGTEEQEDDGIPFEEKMKTILGTKVIINQKDSMKGKIEIEYYSPDELTRIYELIESIKK